MSSNSKNKTTTPKKHTSVPTAEKKPATTPTITAPAVAAIAAPTVTAPAVATPAAAKPAVEATRPAATAVENKIEPLLESLHDMDADTAREAATSLGLSGNPSAVAPLIEVIRNENRYFHSVVRSAAAIALGQLKDARAIEPLLDAVSDPIADPSSEAIRALATIGNPRAVSALVDVVSNRDGYFVTSVRRSAVLGLIQLGGEDATNALRAVASDTWEDTVIRDEAAAATRSR